MAITLAQSLGQNIGIFSDKKRILNGGVLFCFSLSAYIPFSISSPVFSLVLNSNEQTQFVTVIHLFYTGECKCDDKWSGCIMDDVG